MNNSNPGCIVASSSKTQPCNSSAKNATDNATNNATNNLLSLAMQVLRRYETTTNATSSATNKLRSGATHTTEILLNVAQDKQLHCSATSQTSVAATALQKSCAVAFCKGGNYATKQIDSLIRKVSAIYGGDERDFLDEYINNVIRTWPNDINKVIKCFSTLVRQKTNARAQSMVSCDKCEHFTADKIGDSAGIGSCKRGIKWTQTHDGKMPLYRYADRHCDQFSKLQA